MVLESCPMGHFVLGYDINNELEADAKCVPCETGTYNNVDGLLPLKCLGCRGVSESR